MPATITDKQHRDTRARVGLIDTGNGWRFTDSHRAGERAPTLAEHTRAQRARRRRLLARAHAERDRSRDMMRAARARRRKLAAKASYSDAYMQAGLLSAAVGSAQR